MRLNVYVHGLQQGLNSDPKELGITAYKEWIK